MSTERVATFTETPGNLWLRCTRISGNCFIEVFHGHVNLICFKIDRPEVIQCRTVLRIDRDAPLDMHDRFIAITSLLCRPSFDKLPFRLFRHSMLKFVQRHHA